MKFNRTNPPNTNPEQVLTELTNRINDSEILSEINNRFNFSGDDLFVKSFKDHIRLSGKSKSLVKPSKLLNEIENLDSEQIYSLASETIVLEFGRPALIVQNDTYEYPQSEIWSRRLNSGITNGIGNVGRIELQNSFRYRWCGTGWFLANTPFLITNRHVAEIFAESNGSTFRFKKNLDNKTISAFFDTKEEYAIDEEIVYKVDKVVYLATTNEPDVAILEVSQNSQNGNPQPSGLTISQAPSNQDDFVYTVGYPARDSRVLDSNLMSRIFRDVYDVKRLAPGKITSVNASPNNYFHDCSTLGGNSGSPLIDLNSGQVVGLHFAGTYLERNWAVSSEYLNELLNQFISV